MIYITPAVFALILISALRRGVPVYSAFTEGVKSGLDTVLSIFPPLLAIFTAVEMFKASGCMEAALSLLSPLTERLRIPTEIMPLVLLRPLSGSGAIGIYSDILAVHGADSLSGRLASVILGSTETTFYTLMVYFSQTGIKYTKRAIPAAVFGDIVSVAVGTAVCRIFF